MMIDDEGDLRPGEDVLRPEIRVFAYAMSHMRDSKQAKYGDEWGERKIEELVEAVIEHSDAIALETKARPHDFIHLANYCMMVHWHLEEL
jgi:hypothetical protein